MDNEPATNDDDNDNEPPILNTVEKVISLDDGDPEYTKTLSSEYRKIIKTLYPGLHTEVYCVPPIHMNTLCHRPYAGADTEHLMTKYKTAAREKPQVGPSASKEGGDCLATRPEAKASAPKQQTQKRETQADLKRETRGHKVLKSDKPEQNESRERKQDSIPPNEVSDPREQNLPAVKNQQHSSNPSAPAVLPTQMSAKHTGTDCANPFSRRAPATQLRGGRSTATSVNGGASDPETPERIPESVDPKSTAPAQGTSKEREIDTADAGQTGAHESCAGDFCPGKQSQNEQPAYETSKQGTLDRDGQRPRTQEESRPGTAPRNESGQRPHAQDGPQATSDKQDSPQSRKHPQEKPTSNSNASKKLKSAGGQPEKPAVKTHVQRKHTQTQVQTESKLETVKADDAQQRTLAALKKLASLLGGPCFILSNLKFSDYLNYTPNKKASQAVARLPRPSDLDQHGKPQAKGSTRGKKARRVEGDWDVLMIQPDRGIVLLEVKSVPEKPDASKVPEGCNPLATVEERVRHGLSQLQKGSNVASHLVSDLGEVPVWKGLVLPNVSRKSLRNVLKTLKSKDLEKLGVADVESAVSRCLCQEDLPAPGVYDDITPDKLTRLQEWLGCIGQPSPTGGPVLDKNKYEHIVARFCGPLTTVRLYDPCGKLREVRTLREATSLTADRFSAIVLTQQQVNVLEDEESKHVHITGPPGSGKSVLLQCKAQEWVSQKQPVIIIAGCVESVFICQHIYKALSKKKLVSLFRMFDKDAKFEKLLGKVQSSHPSKPVLIIFDEYDDRMGKVFGNIPLDSGKLKIWSASAWEGEGPKGRRGSQTAQDSSSSDLKTIDQHFKTVRLDRVMRSPPAVQNLLRSLQPQVHFYGTPCAIPSPPRCPPDQCPPPTYGVEVKLISHANHRATDIWDCKRCGRELGLFLKDKLHLGLSPEGLEFLGRGNTVLNYSDVLVLSAVLGWEAVNTNHEKPFIKEFKKTVNKRRAHVELEFANPTRDRKTHEFPHDKMVFTRCDSVLGWESKVVIFVPHKGAEGAGDDSDLEELTTATTDPGDLFDRDADFSASSGPKPLRKNQTVCEQSMEQNQRGKPADGANDLEKAIATLSHANQEDAYKAFAGTIALAVLFHF